MAYAQLSNYVNVKSEGDMDVIELDETHKKCHNHNIKPRLSPLPPCYTIQEEWYKRSVVWCLSLCCEASLGPDTKPKIDPDAVVLYQYECAGERSHSDLSALALFSNQSK